jgi:hypothetical protein
MDGIDQFAKAFLGHSGIQGFFDVPDVRFMDKVFMDEMVNVPKLQL